MRSLLTSLVVLFSLQASIRSEYKPGKPGGAWSEEELLIVRGKLWKMYANNWHVRKWWKNGEITNPGLHALNTDRANSDLKEYKELEELGFFPAKVLRLSFHDCLRYKDGSGGCDGCLNWEGVNKRFDPASEMKLKFEKEDVTETNNNGLEYAVAVLEELYTNPDFPPGNPKLSESLKSSGKSRWEPDTKRDIIIIDKVDLDDLSMADLWAYAAKVAVEYTVELNNYQCQDNPTDWAGSSVETDPKDCMRNKGADDCEARLPREIKFKFGRADCRTKRKVKYQTKKTEIHPNPNGNGADTLKFYDEQFSFSPRETVAIMGAHTLGRMYPNHSMMKYVWTARNGHLFNNAYYKNFVHKKDWFIEVRDNDTCSLLGDADGTLPDVKWVPTLEGFTKSGGPMHWIRYNYACPYCGHRPTKGFVHEFLAMEYDKCCGEKIENKKKMCKPNNKPRNFINDHDADNCERFRFAFGEDEMAMNCEMGLYLQFDVENGIPKNCPGLENFNMENWVNDRNKFAYNQSCPLNMHQEDGDLPVSSIIAEYASDQDLWIRDFIPALEKMMENGYEQTDLTEAPGSWEDVRCVGGVKTTKCSKS